MLHIKPVYTSYEREEYASAAGFTYTDGAFCVVALEDDLVKGASLYRVENGVAELYEIGFAEGCTDETVRILLAKGTLNVIDHAGISDVVFTSQNIPFIKGVGFREKDGKLTLNLEGYFNDPCKN